ncbi:phage tail protein [Paenibacillus hunanensis]|uniref:Microcystin-dependent protein n=1 Tax=Paenibacillus hunanensis TaxID=539262 RepID=A0ABU1J385_9BACL|nr:tail fiber protein [Paenibacillus hunanensis]MDR6245869.1 microcystin-dependent protein [Paenibacillus hunanensis]GGJ14144.1 microcystin dependent protein [Paenibacillus hunanensis]
MSDQYVGEIRMFTGVAGTKVPQGWAFCDGTVLQISQNEVLYALIGNQYGGDGVNTFALPDLRGRLAIHNGTLTPSGPNFGLASTGGSENVQLTTAQLPVHTHNVSIVSGQTSATTPTPTNATLPATSTINMYGTASSTTTTASMNSQSISSNGGNGTHNNMMPYLTITYMIALQGIYPSPS